MTNPYESPVTPVPPRLDPRARTALIPFLIAVPSILVAALLWFWQPFPLGYISIAIGVIGAILAFDLPVCALVVFEWLRTGQPPELSLSPLIPSREEREFRRILRTRPKLNDDDFYATFYSDSPIPKSLVVQLRKSLECAFGLDFGALQPTDNLILADPELDWADIVFRLNREFGIRLTNEMFGKFDGTFDSLVALVQKGVN
jgi:hypothetical protein